MALPLCLCVFRVEPLCCELVSVHAVESFREELESGVGLLLSKGSGLLLLAGFCQPLTGGISDRET